jgi:hypothetical protein
MKPQSAKRFDDLTGTLEGALLRARARVENRSVITAAVDKASRHLAGLRAARAARREDRK